MRSPRRYLSLVLVLTMLLSCVPAVAEAVTAPRPLCVRPTAQQLKAKGGAAIRALALGDPEIPVVGYVEGHVTHTGGGMWEDAGLFVLAFEYDSDIGEWMPAEISEVATDGAYSVGVRAAGDYRIGVFDWANVYADAYYDGAADLDTADSVSVAASETVTGIDVDLTPLPENIISGTVAFSGAATPTADIESDDFVIATAWQYDAEWEDWMPASDALVRADGTYRIHLREPGTFRVAFDDYSGIFASVFYEDAASAEEATDVVCASPATAPTGIDQTMTAIPSRRVFGESRYDTAVEASKLGFREESTFAVVLATGENWPDAISGSAMAARIGAPLLLTRGGSLPQCTADEIRRLRPSEIIIVGGYPAISLDVEIELRTRFDAPMIWRLAGRDRYETAALVAEMLSKDGGGVGIFAAGKPRASFVGTEFAGVVVATGERFPDAMSAAPLAANADAPVLLVRRDGVPPSVADFMRRHGGEFTSALVVGSGSVISTSTAAQFPSWTRIYGDDRYGTAAAVAEYGVEHFGMRDSSVGIASGTSFPDGLAAIPVLAYYREPLLLTRPDTLSPPAERFMVEHQTTHALVFGGESAVSAETFERILDVLEVAGP